MIRVRAVTKDSVFGHIYVFAVHLNTVYIQQLGSQYTNRFSYNISTGQVVDACDGYVTRGEDMSVEVGEIKTVKTINEYGSTVKEQKFIIVPLISYVSGSFILNLLQKSVNCDKLAQGLHRLGLKIQISHNYATNWTLMSCLEEDYPVQIRSKPYLLNECGLRVYGYKDQVRAYPISLERVCYFIEISTKPSLVKQDS